MRHSQRTREKGIKEFRKVGRVDLACAAAGERSMPAARWQEHGPADGGGAREAPQSELEPRPRVRRETTGAAEDQRRKADLERVRITVPFSRYM
jgi:hypothetical protein